MKATIAMALTAAVSAAGCATTTDDSADIGSSDQAVGLALTTTGDTAYDAKFPAFIPINSTEMLVVGGFDNSVAGSTNKIRKVAYNSGSATATYSKYTSGGVEITLNHARGEAQMVQVSPGVFAVFGGKSKESTNSQLSTVEIINLNNSPITVVDVTQQLASGRVNFGLTPCGDKWLVSGGYTTTGNPVATLEVFSYVATSNGANSTIATMKNADNGTSIVAMSNARAFHAALALPDSIGTSAGRILLAAGENPSAAGVMGDSEILDVNSSCQFLDSDNLQTKLVPFTGPSLPSSAVRTHFASAARTVVFSAITHRAILAGGDNGLSANPVTYLYQDNATPAFAVWRTGPTLASAHVRPTFAERSNGDFAIVGGLSGLLGASDTTVEADLFTDSTDTFTNFADLLNNGRIGAFVAYLGASPNWIAGHGAKVVSGTQTFLRTAE